MALAPVASIMINHFGYRIVTASGCVITSLGLVASSYVTDVYQLFGTFTFLMAVGCCMAYTPCMTIASDYFDEYLTTATGIMTAGTSTGTLILTPIAQALYQKHGWRYTLRFFACTCSIGFICSFSFKPLYERPKTLVRRIKSSMSRHMMEDLQLWKNKVYIIWICSIFCVMFGYYIPYVHLVSTVQYTTS